MSTVVAAMSVYRKTILEATIDAPIAELVSGSDYRPAGVGWVEDGIIRERWLRVDPSWLRKS